MRYRPNTYREFLKRPFKPSIDQAAWDWFTEQHNAEPIEMFYRRAEGYPGCYTALIEVIGVEAQKFRIPRKAVPRHQAPVPIQGRRRTRVTIHEHPPEAPPLRGLWNSVAKQFGEPESLRFECTARGPKRVTVILETQREIRFTLDEKEQRWVLGV